MQKIQPSPSSYHKFTIDKPLMQPLVLECINSKLSLTSTYLLYMHGLYYKYTCTYAKAQVNYLLPRKTSIMRKVQFSIIIR